MSFLRTPKILGCAAVVSTFLLILPAGGASAPRTDFSGTWKLNPALSSFAPLPPLKQMIDRIEQTESGLKIHRTLANENRERTTDIVLKTDGIDVVTKHTTGESRMLARWDGAALVVESSLEFEGLPIQVRDRWTLTHDGHCLEIQRHFETHQGAIEQTIVLDRQ